MTTWLRNARTIDGRLLDVALADGRVSEVRAAGDSATGAGSDVLDLDGYLLLASFVEPHAHLDKALTISRATHEATDALSAFNEMRAIALGFDHDDIVSRAEAALRIYLAYGTTTIRSHVNVGAEFGMRTLAALVEVRDRWHAIVDLELVALVTLPLEGEGADVLRQALAAGVGVVGGWLERESHPHAAVGKYLEIAGEFGVPIDLHTDETLDRSVLTLEAIADTVLDRGYSGRVTASHCVSLAMQPEGVQQRVSEKLARAGVTVVTLPQSNLYLQGRDQPVATPRGLTAIHSLRRAGVVVAAGGDNLRDVFNPVGRGDALEIGALMVAAAHLSVNEAIESVSAAGRAVMGREPVELSVGSPADLVAVRAVDANDALGGASPDRIVWKAGRQIARTTLSTELVGPA
jgi:cytosine deaminase